ncbi:hypothetical protein H6F67_04305 [Microcoleus sp. FACHB-1515]|uniref:hypothetical protein n=1 Tax=Cyanophyceae TaxID=3028117 RepID=UPI0016850324|nr:hypothetical protein [Microcoleus sp. FACHB-1515]MBD2089077.1 hypothetical protein [Microcoleus sp. FACHB-1515]
MPRKWEQAFYRDRTGVERKVQADELHDPTRRAFLKTQELWDADGEIRLFIRARSGAPHFYSLCDSVRQFISRAEHSRLHNQRVDQLLAALQPQGFSFGYRNFTAGEPAWIELFSTEQYRWEKEVTRTLGAIRWRHDLFAAQLAHRLSDRSPLVAIEVIDSHFPAAAAFEAWLKLSAEMPCLVLFDFIRKKNYFFQVDKQTHRVRVVFYIFDGFVWRSGQPWAGCTANWSKEKVRAEI